MNTFIKNNNFKNHLDDFIDSSENENESENECENESENESKNDSDIETTSKFLSSSFKSNLDLFYSNVKSNMIFFENLLSFLKSEKNDESLCSEILDNIKTKKEYLDINKINTYINLLNKKKMMFIALKETPRFKKLSDKLNFNIHKLHSFDIEFNNEIEELNREKKYSEIKKIEHLLLVNINKINKIESFHVSYKNLILELDITIKKLIQIKNKLK